MSETKARKRKLYDPHEAAPWTPRKEWVALADGSEICVWELSVPESFQVAEAAQRHPQDPRPGQNESDAALWLVALACRRDDEPLSPRVWNDMEMGRILQLNPQDFTKLLIAARFMLQATEEGQERVADFIAPGAVASGAI
jgi:hypothetical protein